MSKLSDVMASRVAAGRGSVLIGISVISLMLAACSSSGSGSGEADTVTAIQTVTAPVPSGPTTAAAKVVSTPTDESIPKGGDGNGPFVMPNEVGKVLQEAQDDIQRVSGNMFFYTDSSDASGQGRMQLVDSNWKVCSQNVGPGAKVNQDADISFAAVKLDESCP